MSYFIRRGNSFNVSSEESLDIHNKLPIGNYTVMFDNMSGSYFLEMVDVFSQVDKVYGDTLSNSNRILKTFESRPNSTGIMLSGQKGSGKTLLAKTLSIECAKVGIPTIIINHAYHGDLFNKFMQDIEQPCMVLFDEFEKVFDNESQEAILTLFDGVYSSKKLFVITCNDKWRVNDHMKNRPGRIFYLLEYSGISEEFIIEYCNDNLNDKQYIEKVSQVSGIFLDFNFDMLKAIVEEMNRFDESPQEAMKMLNMKPEYNNHTRYKVKLVVSGKELNYSENSVDDSVTGNPISHSYSFDWCEDSSDDSPYYTSEFSPNDIIKVDGANGIFVLKNEKNEVLTLTQEKENVFDYHKYLV